MSTNYSPKNKNWTIVLPEGRNYSRIVVLNTQIGSWQLCVFFILSHIWGHKTSRLHNFHLPLDYSLHVSTHHFGQGAYSPLWTWRKTKDKCIVGGLLKIDNTYNLQKTSPRQTEWAISLHFNTIDRKEQIIPVCKGQENINIDFV